MDTPFFHVRARMDGRTFVNDNISMKSFWGMLKKELAHHSRYVTRQEAIREITEHIEIFFYNRQRRQKRLGYLFPVAYERRYYEKQFVA